MLDNENHLYHVVVKGMHVKDGKEVNTQVRHGDRVVSTVKCEQLWPSSITNLRLPCKIIYNFPSVGH